MGKKTPPDIRLSKRDKQRKTESGRRLPSASHRSRPVCQRPLEESMRSFWQAVKAMDSDAIVNAVKRMAQPKKRLPTKHD